MGTDPDPEHVLSAILKRFIHMYEFNPRLVFIKL